MFAAATNAVNNAAAGAVNAVNNAAAGVANAANVAVQNLGAGVNKAVNAVTNTAAAVPAAVNSLIPFANNVAPAPAAANQSDGLLNDAVNGVINAVNNLGGPANNGKGANNFLNAVNNAVGNAGANNSKGGMFSGALGIFLGLFALFLVIFAVFNEQIREGYEYMIVYFKQMLGLETRPDVVSQITPAGGDVKSLTVPPPGDADPADAPVRAPSTASSIVEKVLPSPGGNEVYNVAQNNYTYYDAEPLCKALGAELATYDQVRDAWAKGADWCNYGWTKGQMAVYPTQRGTYDKLQNGPPEEKRACGTVGLNGGVFDNPELRFGVNCYGPKPSQTNHDEKSLMQQGKVPRGPETLAVDRKIAEFKEAVDSMFIRPFNTDKWHA
jgi:hypothetical protein